MLDIQAHAKALREIIRALLGMPEHSVRPANQNAPTGTMQDQFVTVLISSVTSEGWDDQTFRDLPSPSLEVEERAEGQRRLVASVQFFRGDAFNKACRLRTLLGLSSAVAACRAAGLGFIQASAVRDLSVVVDTYWEARAQLDLEFYFITDETSNMPTYGLFPVSISTPSRSSSFEVTAP